MSQYIQHLMSEGQYLFQRLTLTRPIEDVLSIPINQEEIYHNFQAIQDICRETSFPREQRSSRKPLIPRRPKFSDPFKFQRFPELPTELRRQVWQCSVEGRWELGRKNAIEVLVAQERLYENPPDSILVAKSSWGTVLSPLLQTCHESRAIVQESFPHTIPCGYGDGLMYFHGAYEVVHIRKMQMISAPESFLAFGSLSKPLRRNRNPNLPRHFLQIENLNLDFESSWIMDKVFPGDYLILLSLFPNLRKVEGCVGWLRGDVEKDQRLESALSELEGKWPAFWKRAQKRYIATSKEFGYSKISLKFEVDDLDYGISV